MLSLNINSHEVDVNVTNLKRGLYIARIQTDKDRKHYIDERVDCA